MELITTLHSKIIDPPIPIQHEDNEFDALDSHLMDMDFEGILELSNPATNPTSFNSSQQSTSSHPPTAPSQTIPDPFRFAPFPGLPSMQIQRQVAYYQQILKTKEAKSKALNAFTLELLHNCPLCWAYQGELVPRHKDGLWIKC